MESENSTKDVPVSQESTEQEEGIKPFVYHPRIAYQEKSSNSESSRPGEEDQGRLIYRRKRPVSVNTDKEKPEETKAVSRTDRSNVIEFHFTCNKKEFKYLSKVMKFVSFGLLFAVITFLVIYATKSVYYQ